MKKISKYLYALSKIDHSIKFDNDSYTFATSQGFPIASVLKQNDEFKIFIYKNTPEIIKDFEINREKYRNTCKTLLRVFETLEKIPLDYFKKSLVLDLKFLTKRFNLEDAELYSKKIQIVGTSELFDILVGDLKLAPSMFENYYGVVTEKSTGRMQDMPYKKWHIFYDTSSKSSLDSVKTLLDNAESRLSSNGLQKLAYGKVYIVNTLAGNAIADYAPENDIVRVSLKKIRKTTHETIDSFLHELGHRNFYKNLSSDQKSEIRTTFNMNQISKKSVEKDDIVVDKETGNRYQIIKSVYKRSLSYLAKLIEVKKETKKLKLNQEYFIPSDLIGTVLIIESQSDDNPNSSFFPSTYSLKNYEEFYAELFSHWMNKTLKEPAKTWFINLHKGV